MDIKELVIQAHKNAVEKGFWDAKDDIDSIRYDIGERYIDIVNWHTSNMLMLIVSELGEALESLRKNDHDNFREELADVIIRVGDMCGGLNIDIEFEIEQKMAKNKLRPRLHGKKF